MFSNIAELSVIHVQSIRLLITIWSALMIEREKNVARILLENNCVMVRPSQPFSYASGLKGPLYCDNRQILSLVDARSQVMEYLIDLIDQSGIEYDLICGLATAGIPHASILADRLERPLIYARSDAKKHGKNNAIEGRFLKGQKVLIIEDLVNQGSSLDKAINHLKDAELEVTNVLCLVNYGMKNALNVLKEHNVTLESLTDFDCLCLVAHEMGDVSIDELEILKSWQKDPENWGPNSSKA